MAPSIPSPAEAAPPHKRVVAIDVLRLLATVQMLQGHAIDAVLAASHRHGLLHGVWQHLRGYTAPAFLFAAGFAFYLTTLRSHTAHVPWVKRRRRLRRELMLIAIGYAMRFPIGLAFGAEGEPVWRAFAIVDVLQCIGWSLLVLELLSVVLSRRVVLFAAAVLGAACFWLEPLLADVVWPLPWRFLSNYLSSAGGSIFPVVPHAGYVFAGVAIGACTTPAGRPLSLPRLAVATLALALMAALLWSLDWAALRWQRLAVVLAVLGIIGQLRGAKALGGFWSTITRQTLVIYLAHVVVLYGHPWGVSTVIGRTFAPTHAVLFALLVIVASLAFGVLWEKLQGRTSDIWALLGRKTGPH